MNATAQTDVQQQFAAAGLPAPPVPPGFPVPLRRWNDWTFATAEPAANPWDVGLFVDAAIDDPAPFLLIAHAGYGMNSAAIHYFLVWQGLGVFVQTGWGGAHTDNAAAGADLQRQFAAVEALIRAAPATLGHGSRLFAVEARGDSRWARSGEGGDGGGWHASPRPLEDALASLGEVGRQA